MYAKQSNFILIFTITIALFSKIIINGIKTFKKFIVLDVTTNFFSIKYGDRHILVFKTAIKYGFSF